MKIVSRIQMIKEIVDKHYQWKNYNQYDEAFNEYNIPKRFDYRQAVDELRKIDLDIRGFIKNDGKIIFLNKDKNVLTRYETLYLNPDK